MSRPVAIIPIVDIQGSVICVIVSLSDLDGATPAYQSGLVIFAKDNRLHVLPIGLGLHSMDALATQPGKAVSSETWYKWLKSKLNLISDEAAKEIGKNIGNLISGAFLLIIAVLYVLSHSYCG